MNQLRIALLALGQYADPNNWQSGDGRGRLDQWLPATNGPEVARKALREIAYEGNTFKSDSLEAEVVSTSTVNSDHPRIEKQ